MLKPVHNRRTPQAGALAVWSPTGLSSNYQATRLDRFFLQAAFGGGPMRLGDAILSAMFEHHAVEGAEDTASIYNLLGDPAIPLH